jgi:hypothetical protein
MQAQSLAEQLFFTTVRMETETKTGHGAGTGFFFDYADGNDRYLFVVSNKHVVQDAKRGTLLFTVREGDQPKIGERFTVTLENFGSNWFGHSDIDTDVAIMPLGLVLREVQEKTGKQFYFKAVGSELIPDEAAVQQLYPIEQVLFLGYPNALFDEANLTPIARAGITATPFALDYCGRKTFLIDASVFPGSSGSPVFILNSTGYSKKGGGIVIGSRLLFLGVLAGVFVRLETGQFEIVDIPTAQTPIVTVSQMIDLGLVYKPDVLLQTVRQFLDRPRRPA